MTQKTDPPADVDLTLADAVASVEKYAGCGDNSCLFVKPTGMATNGGCRCIERGSSRPFLAPALAKLFRAARPAAALIEKLRGEGIAARSDSEMWRSKWRTEASAGREQWERAEAALAERDALRAQVATLGALLRVHGKCAHCIGTGVFRHFGESSPCRFCQGSGLMADVRAALAPSPPKPPKEMP